MKKIVRSIVGFISKHKELSQDNLEIVEYGIEVFLLKTIFFICSVTIGLLMGQFFETLIYMLLFIALRTYSGGYHAKTKLQCYILSMLQVVFINVLLMFGRGNNIVYLTMIAFFFISFTIVFLASPVDTKNKELDLEDRKPLKKKTRLILMLQTILIVISILCKLESLFIITMAVVILQAILLIIGKIDNRKMDR